MKEKFDVGGMTCSACSAHVEKAVNKLDGVNSASVNLIQNSMMVDFDHSSLNEGDIIKAVSDAGYTAQSTYNKKTSANGTAAGESVLDTEQAALKFRLIASIVFLVPLLYISMGHMMGLPVPGIFVGDENSITFSLTQFLLTLPIIYVNRPFFINGFKTLIKRSPNMDSLVALGSSAALLYGIYTIYKIGSALADGDMHGVHSLTMDLYFESAATILTLITVGKYLEARSKGKTSDAIKRLMDLTPKTAVRFADGREEVVLIEDVREGDILIVKSGETIPVDGSLTEGTGSVDQSAITGESLPVDKIVGDDLTAGTINKSGFMKMETKRVGEDTTVSGIIRLVEEANTSKAPIARLADKVSGVFVPIVICIAIVTCIIWIIAGKSFDFALSMGIAVLVISCPCALGLATPTAIMVGTGRGAEHGILFKTAESLELAHKIDAVILDKTGTVTEGKLTVTDIEPYGISEDDLIRYAASAEVLSEHPLGQTIVHRAKDSEISLLNAKDFTSHEGRGIQVSIEGKSLIIGNIRMMKEHNVNPQAIELFESKSEEYASRGKTPLFVASDETFLGLIVVSDTIKETSPIAIKELLDLGVEVVMITGDNEKTAKAIAQKAGIANVISDVMPQDKEKEVRKLKEQGKTVAMIGDGINDAPALARADVGIAIGTGTDIAIESADIVLMKSDLLDAVTAIDLSKAVMRNIKQNLFWAFIYNIIGIPLAAGVLYPLLGLKLSPMFAAAAMSLSSFCVVTNALRLRLYKRKTSSSKLDNAKENDDQSMINSEDEVKHNNVINTKSKGEEKMVKTMNIEGMSCMHCSGRVEQVLNDLPGTSAKVDLEDKKAIVKTDGSVDDARLRKTVEDAGYQVVSIE